MGVYSEYLNAQLNFEQLTAERKKQLKRISELRDNRDVLVYAADLNPNESKARAPLFISYEDLLPINDQLSNLHGRAVDLILETNGGVGEIAEEIVKLLHGKYEEVAVIVPGHAKSAGTILAMAGDEILMEPASALGPIDAQLNWQGKSFSADAFLEGFEKIKEEVEKTQKLNKAYIPILQALSPGELQAAENALKFAKELVTEWLSKYKFKNWTTHHKSGEPVTPEERAQLSAKIANNLCDHRRWLTHGRSIKISDLEDMDLLITDYSKNAELADAIRRYHTLLQMTFGTNIYKLFETIDSQIYKFAGQLIAPIPQGLALGGKSAQVAKDAQLVDVEFDCGKCHTISRIQMNLGKRRQIKPGFTAFPSDNILRCPGCGSNNDLSDLRRQVEAQTKKPIVS